MSSIQKTLIQKQIDELIQSNNEIGRSTDQFFKSRTGIRKVDQGIPRRFLYRRLRSILIFNDILRSFIFFCAPNFPILRL